MNLTWIAFCIFRWNSHLHSEKSWNLPFLANPKLHAEAASWSHADQRLLKAWRLDKLAVAGSPKSRPTRLAVGRFAGSCSWRWEQNAMKFPDFSTVNHHFGGWTVCTAKLLSTFLYCMSIWRTNGSRQGLATFFASMGQELRVFGRWIGGKKTVALEQIVGFFWTVWVRNVSHWINWISNFLWS